MAARKSSRPTQRRVAQRQKRREPRSGSPTRSPSRARPESSRVEVTRTEETPLVVGRATGVGPARFPVVGLGASAGGLASLEAFLEHVPIDSGIAYVVITHQAPDRVTMLPELLGKRAKIPVKTASDGMQLSPDTVYVAPPGGSVTIRDEKLFVEKQERGALPSLPIDHTFRSLAHNEGDYAIGIVLSGNGSDGTLGLTEIKGAYGMVMAQEPQSAQYAGMPSSAIATHLVDYVMPPAEMPEQLIRYVRGRMRATLGTTRFDLAGFESALQRILSTLRGRTGSDFSAYKKSTIGRRIERRMQVHGISDPADYAQFLDHTPFEVDALFKELLISVTSFFRDSAAFEALERELAKLIESKSKDETLRVWVPGCATGEEAYSIAILAKELVQRSGRRLKLQIFATDLDQHAVDAARAGRFADGIAGDMRSERLRRFFTREDGGYRVNKDVREAIVFAVQNVIRDPPFTKLDLLSCRNLLIYLESELQKRVLALFSYSIRPGGILLLGTSESVSGFDDQFTTLDKRWKLFQRLPTGAPQTLPDLLGSRAGVGTSHPLARDGHRRPGIASIAEQVLLSSFVPASIVVSERGELIYVHGRIGTYFELPSGEPTQNVFDMAREGLRAELPAAIRQAAASQRPVLRRGLQVKTNGGYSAVSLSVRRLNEPEALRGAFVVSFGADHDREPERESRKRGRGSTRSLGRMSALEEELRRTRENLQGMIEELETSNEELKSTNEELQSTNEELQSTNEELETSREEMQSLNEELQTVNAELEDRNRELSQTNDDMQNLLNSTEVATLFLDDRLSIKRFTTQAKKVFSLIDTDIGRPISDLAANLRYDSLVDDAHEVLRSLVFREREIQTKEGAWRQIRIMPYRTHENLIDGLVITFVDVDRLKQAQRAAEETRAYAEGIVDSLKWGLLVLDSGLRIVSANRAFYGLFSHDPKLVVGHALSSLGEPALSAPELTQRLVAALDGDEGFTGLRSDLDGGRDGKQVELSARRMPQTNGARQLVLTIESVGVPSE